MRRRPLTPSKNSSRTSSRRNETRGIRAAAFIALVCSSPMLSAEDLDLAVSVRDGIIHADAFFRWDRERELIAALRDGMESRITLTIRLYGKRAAFLPFFSNVLIAEKSLSRVAFFDFLEKKFAIESETERKRVFDEPAEMVREFFSWTNVSMGTRPGMKHPSLSARIQFDPVHLMPPLAIVSLAGAAGTYTSPWIRREVEP